MTGLPGEILLPTRTTRLTVGSRGDSGLRQHRIDAEQLAMRRAREQVVQRQHRVGLAAAEVGLELDDRIAAAAGQPPDRARQELLEALRQVRAAEELDGIAVFVGALADVDLPQIGRELGLLVLAAGDVAVRADDLAPRRQVACRLALDRGAGVLRFSVRSCSSNRTRSSSIFIFSTSSACGAETAVSSRAAESSARYASSVENGSWWAHLLRTPRSSLTRVRSACPSVRAEDLVPASHMSLSRAAASHSSSGRSASSRSPNM